MVRKGTAPTLGFVLLVGLAFLVQAGCGWNPFGPSEMEGFGIRTDQASYVAEHLSGEGGLGRYGFSVEAEFTNKTGRTVYLGRCNPNSPTPIFGVTGDGFESAYGGFWACTGHENDFRVGPGKRRIDTLHVVGQSSLGGEWEGRFRISYWVKYCQGDCPDEPKERFQVSDYFEVTLGSGSLLR